MRKRLREWWDRVCKLDPHEHDARCYAGSYDEYWHYGPGPLCGYPEDDE